jgi:hypothetical protein
VTGDLTPMLLAPRTGSEVALRLNEGLLDRLAAYGRWQAVKAAKAAMINGKRGLSATVILGLGRPATLPNGEQVEICSPDHVMHVYCVPLDSERPLAVLASDCELPSAPPLARALLD